MAKARMVHGKQLDAALAKLEKMQREECQYQDRIAEAERERDEARAHEKMVLEGQEMYFQRNVRLNAKLATAREAWGRIDEQLTSLRDHPEIEEAFGVDAVIIRAALADDAPAEPSPLMNLADAMVEDIMSLTDSEVIAEMKEDAEERGMRTALRAAEHELRTRGYDGPAGHLVILSRRLDRVRKLGGEG